MLGLADEDVEPDCYGEGVGEVVFLFGAFFAGRADGIPYVPLVEADLLAADGGGDFVLDASEVDETGCDLDSTLSRTRGCTFVSISAILILRGELTSGVLVVILTSSVNVNAMLINKTSSRASAQTVNVKLDTLLDDIRVP